LKRKKQLVISTQTLRLLTRRDEGEVRGGWNASHLCGSGSGIESIGCPAETVDCVVSDPCNG